MHTNTQLSVIQSNGKLVNCVLSLRELSIQREVADTGSYNIGAEERKRSSNSSVQSDEGIRKTRLRKFTNLGHQGHRKTWKETKKGHLQKRYQEVQLPTTMCSGVEWLGKGNSVCKNS